MGCKKTHKPEVPLRPILAMIVVIGRLIGIGIEWNRVIFEESASGFEHPIPLFLVLGFARYNDFIKVKMIVDSWSFYLFLQNLKNASIFQDMTHQSLGCVCDSYGESYFQVLIILISNYPISPRILKPGT